MDAGRGRRGGGAPGRRRVRARARHGRRKRSPNGSPSTRHEGLDICETLSVSYTQAGLHADLWARNILSRVSERADASKLCDAFHVHFTTPLQAKGLEFDAVFVVDADAYDMRSPTDQAALYVALSRACRRLGVAYRKAPTGGLADLLRQHLAATPGARATWPA